MAIIKHKSQRVGIFIDTQNLYHSAKNLYKAKVNFGQVVKEAVAGRNLIRAIAYVIRTESDEEKGFFEALKKLDTIILATGDGDFVPLVEYLKYTYGVQVEVIAFGKSSSGQLREAVDDFIDICEDPRAFLIGYRGGVGRYIPGFGGKSGADSNAGRVNADTIIETTEWDGEGEDPAIKMSGE